MRQRLAAVGGNLDAGPSTGGGFRLDARVPLRRDDIGDERDPRAVAGISRI
jgi:hypothetical protein